jgi:hypothetical protein
MRMLKTNLKGTYDRNVNMDHVMDKKPEMNVNVEYKAGIQVHQAGETNMYEEALMRLQVQERERGNHRRCHVQHGVRGWPPGLPRRGGQHLQYSTSMKRFKMCVKIKQQSILWFKLK